jgi:hypothetical protein
VSGERYVPQFFLDMGTDVNSLDEAAIDFKDSV